MEICCHLDFELTRAIDNLSSKILNIIIFVENKVYLQMVYVTNRCNQHNPLITISVPCQKGAYCIGRPQRLIVTQAGHYIWHPSCKMNK